MESLVLPDGLPEYLTVAEVGRIFRIRDKDAATIVGAGPSIATLVLVAKATYHDGATRANLLAALAAEYAGAPHGFFGTEAAHRTFGLSVDSLALPRVTLSDPRLSLRTWGDMLQLFANLAKNEGITPLALLQQLVAGRRRLLSAMAIRQRFNLKSKTSTQSFLEENRITYLQVPYRHGDSGTGRFILEPVAG